MRSKFMFLVILGWSCWAGGLRAQEPPPPQDKRWKDKAEVSLVSTGGNSRATSLSAKNSFNYDWAKVGLEVVAAGLGTESQDQVTAEQYAAAQKMTWKFSGKSYAYERLGWDKNRFAGILHRYDFSGGLGYAVWDLPMNQLLVEAGAGYINEERDASARVDFGSARAYGKLTHVLTRTATFSQDGEYVASAKDNEDFRAKAETALIASISTAVSMKAAYIWKRTGRPTPGFGKDDTLTSLSLIVNY